MMSLARKGQKLLFIILSIISIQGFAQIGNEWINYNQFYYKIPVAKDGIYRLTYANLENAGFPVNSVDPRRLQLFHRGVEQAIYVDGEDDAVFDEGDFIDFYGQRNDGTMDAELYKPITAQPHKYYNLYSDTTSYFLTFNPLPVLGSRMEYWSDINVGGVPKETSHNEELISIYNDTYWTGVVYGDYIHNSFFDETEGWTGAEVRQGTVLDYTISNVVHGDATKSKPQLEILLIGRNLDNHETIISVGASAGGLRTATTVDFFGYTTQKVTIPLEWTDIASNGKLIVRINPVGISSSPDRISVSYLKLNFPQNFLSDGASEKKYNLNENPFGQSYIEIQNPALGLRLFDITDLSNVKRIRVTETSTTNALVQSTTTARKLFATNVVNVAATIKRITFRKIVQGAQDYVIVSHRSLMKAALGYSDAVKEYGGYRASSVGGGYDTLIVDINQLYDQFNYGEVSSVAIFHFMKYLCAVKPPKYLFLIGKGLLIYYNYNRQPGSYTKYKDLIPPSGFPGSDMFFSAGLAGTTNEPAVPTGRISAMSAIDVAAYLNKVKEMESLPFNGLWRKNILHLSGGIRIGEPEKFRTYMQGFQEVAEGYYLGGKVQAIAKKSTDIKLINVSDEINNGVDLVTFYGHSSPSATDFEIGFASDPVMGYNNPGKYPTLLMNGCNAGSFFLNGYLFGEDWINTPNKGAIGFIASSTYGFEGLLKQYTDRFYGVAYGDKAFINKGLGDVQKNVAATFTSSPSIFDISQVQQMVLLGDPSVKLFGAKKPDYEINENNLFIESFNGSPISLATDSFALRIIVRNFGIAADAPLKVKINRIFNDGSTEPHEQIFDPVKYSDTLVFVIKKNSDKGFGNNGFSIKLDSDDSIDEIDEDNNEVTKEFVIPLNGTKNVYPSDFAIVNAVDVKLAFQTTDLLSGKRNFLLEVDTIDTFSSAFKKQFTTQATVLAQQSITILSKDSVTYYWRTKLAEPQSAESNEWVTSSFTFIKDGNEGWGQIHFPQFKGNVNDGLIQDPNAKLIKFKETVTTVSVLNFGSASSVGFTNTSFKIDGSEYNLYTQGFGCRTSTLNIVAFDKSTTVPYATNSHVCGRAPMIIHSFQYDEMDTGTGEDISGMVDNIVSGDSVVLFSMGNAYYELWPAAAKTKLAELGISSAQIAALQSGEPTVIFGKKGSAPGSAKIIKTSGVPANKQTLQVDGTITGRYNSGKMKTRIIGPASHWEKFTRNIKGKEVSDDVSVDIYGVSLNGVETLLYPNLLNDLDLTSVDANTYPLLRLNYNVSDNVNLTAAQLKNWIVIFDPVAEGVVIHRGPLEQDPVLEGLDWSDDYGFVNISNKQFSDSLKVKIEYFNKTTRTIRAYQIKIKAPSPSDTTKFTIGTNTMGIGGLNDVTVFVNPYIVPEQYYDNNTIELPDFLNVKVDEANPVIDVTFDGRVIENNDFVSASPTIKIKVWDENHVIQKKDTVGMNVYLKKPCAEVDCPFERILFSDKGIMTWFPATDTSSFNLIYTPQSLEEGTYSLKVEAKDAKGNGGVDVPYNIDFKVHYADSVVIMNPRPNPSNGSFYFNFLVVGEKSPSYLSLQIESLEGRIIRTIKLNEDSLRIGLNNLIWEGIDDSGSYLPAGMYIYHMELRSSASTTKKSGKLVLVK